MVVYNEEDYIEKAIDSLFKQDIGNYDLEIIIVDGNSTDGTRDIVSALGEENPQIHIIDNPDRIVPIGFNRALSICKGSIIIRLDGHAAVKSNYVTQCLKILERTSADCVGGPIINSSNGIIGKSINIAQSSNFGTGGASFRSLVDGGKYVSTLAFGAYKRNVFNEIGGYDEELIRNQDDEFNLRLIQSGRKIWLDSSIQSIYYPRSTFLKLFKQYFQYGFYKIRVIQKRAGFSSWRHIAPLCFVLILIITNFLFFYYKISFPLLLVIGMYLSISIIASSIYLFRFKCNLFSIVLLPLSYFLMHFSYGMGNLIGIIYFMNKWNDRELKDVHFNIKMFSKNAPH